MKVYKKESETKFTKISDTGEYLPLAGGTLTGNLTGKYITGTWLQTTTTSDLGKAPPKVAVLDSQGWIYYRTPAELLEDMGGYTKPSGGIPASDLAGNIPASMIDGLSTATTPVITATASVDSGTGTPAVSVTKSGTNANPSFKFAFSNLKGAKGDKGDKGDIAELADGSITNGKIANGAVSKAKLADDVKGYLLDLIYPVGSVYLSIENNPPGKFLGGSWEEISGGSCLQTASTYYNSPYYNTAGNTIPAGLPNLQGAVADAVGAWGTRSGSSGVYRYGVFKVGSKYYGSNSEVGSSGDTISKYQLTFNASDYNSIYGKSTTVQPEAFRVYAWIRTA